ncbi:hypothetical protein CRENBAI_017142 [Crenichthys baileyi]|uniref:Uncharacterized protein n=1 Tax=Crenichthys baileyi TaxID=28760 RepID=A0AAV9S454_9TELE
MESLGGALSSTPDRDAKNGRVLCTTTRLVSRNDSQRPVPNPKAQGCDPLIHWGKPQHETAELGGNKQTHPSTLPLPVGHFRVEESPAPLEEMGSRAHAVRGEPAYSSGDRAAKISTFVRCPILFAPVPHGSPCSVWAHWGMALHLSFGLGPAGSRKEQPSHQALCDESQPQAWLQGGTPAPTYRATSRALIF